MIRGREQDINPQHQQQIEIIPKIKGEIITDNKQVEEFKQAFVTKGEKLPRTPPEDQVRDYVQQQ
jgi:hypothetical protein